MARRWATWRPRASPRSFWTGAARAVPTGTSAWRDRGHVVRVEDYLADLAAVLERLEQLSLPRPYLILAHSMGGHIALRYLHDHPAQLRRRDADRAHVRHPPAADAGAGGSRHLPARDRPRRRHALRARPAGLRPRALRLRHQQADHLPRALRRLLARQLAATPELALGGVTYGWLGAALRSLAVVRRPGLPGGDPDPDPGVPGRHRAHRQQPRAGAGGAAAAARPAAPLPRAPSTSCCWSGPRSVNR